MSEFLSNCPKCRQRIMCDTLYVGQRVACPVCLQEIVMPAPPVERPAASAANAQPQAQAAPAGGRRVPLPAVVIGAVVILLVTGAILWKVKSGSNNSAPPGAVAAAPVTAPVSQSAVAPPDVRPRANGTPVVLGAHKTQFVLVGDNTINETYGWGLGFKEFLSDQAECTILANPGGRPTQSYQQDGHWAAALALKGDYYLINFGLRSTDVSTFITELEQYVDDVRANGSQPILVTPMVRRQWDKTDTKINSSLAPYAEAVRKVASEKHVPLVDLHERSLELCESLGREACNELSPIKMVDGKTSYDGTGLNAKGSVKFAKLVVDELCKVAPKLTPDFRINPNGDLQAIRN